MNLQDDFCLPNNILDLHVHHQLYSTCPSPFDSYLFSFTPHPVLPLRSLVESNNDKLRMTLLTVIQKLKDLKNSCVAKKAVDDREGRLLEDMLLELKVRTCLLSVYVTIVTVSRLP